MDLGNVLISNITYQLSKLIPKKKYRWVFGAWFGNSISDNSLALCKYVAEHYPTVEIAWVVREPYKFKDCPYKLLKRNSVSAVKYLITSKVAVFNQGYVDFSTFNFVGGVYKAQLWHGVAWKKIGYDALPEPKEFKNRLYRKAYENVSKYNLYIAPCDSYGNTVKNALGANNDELMRVGQPRNEIFFDTASIESSRKNIICRISEEFGLKGTTIKKIITYMPTFRDNTDEVFSFLGNDIIFADPDFYSYLEKNGIVLVEKSHFAAIQRTNIQDNSAEGSKRIVGISDIDAQELLAATDILITDYSSCFFDFLILDRPIIHYAYDYDYYRNDDRGMYYTIDEVAGGVVVKDVQSLVNAIYDSVNNPDGGSEIRKQKREKFTTYESAENSQKIVDKIMKDVYRGRIGEH